MVFAGSLIDTQPTNTTNRRPLQYMIYRRELPPMSLCLTERWAELLTEDILYKTDAGQEQSCMMEIITV